MLKVLKFGGTSVGTLDRIQNVANIIKKIRDEGHDIIAVVSALLKLAGIEIGEEQMQAVYDAAVNFATVAAPIAVVIRNWWAKRKAK